MVFSSKIGLGVVIGGAHMTDKVDVSNISPRGNQVGIGLIYYRDRRSRYGCDRVPGPRESLWIDYGEDTGS